MFGGTNGSNALTEAYNGWTEGCTNQGNYNTGTAGLCVAAPGADMELDRS